MFFSSGAYISGLFIAGVSGCGRGTGEGGVGLGRGAKDLGLSAEGFSAALFYGSRTDD